MTAIPRIYLYQAGLPLYWRNEETGQLPVAIMAYLNGTLAPAQTELVIEYLQYYINAPCWEQSAEGDSELAELRSLAGAMRTPADVYAFVARCLDHGIDPI